MLCLLYCLAGRPIPTLNGQLVVWEASATAAVLEEERRWENDSKKEFTPKWQQSCRKQRQQASRFSSVWFLSLGFGSERFHKGTIGKQKNKKMKKYFVYLVFLHSVHFVYSWYTKYMLMLNAWSLISQSYERLSALRFVPVLFLLARFCASCERERSNLS